ncbi:MAG: class I SAM-dependent methyltransferase [Elusimicrobia bacterium]|nr:class I SAM-dependent methyltransferase [Elusimicrobiota bacterium]
MKDNNGRDDDFLNYSSRHVVPRKGEPTVQRHRFQAAQWRKSFGRFLDVSPDGLILDVGCGDGSLLAWIQSLGWKSAEGIDISREQVEICRKLGVHNVEVADVRCYLASRLNRYVLIFFRDVLEHIPKQEIPSLLSLCRASLCPGGRLVFQVPNGESPYFGRIRYGDFTHETAFTVSSLSQLFRGGGLNPEGFWPWEFVARGIPSLIRLALWKVVEGIYRLLLFVEVGSGFRRIVSQNLIAAAQRPSEGKDG